MLRHYSGKGLQCRVHHGLNVLRIKMLAKSGGTGDVHEEDGRGLQLLDAQYRRAQDSKLVHERCDSHGHDSVSQGRALRLEGCDR